MKTIQRQMIVGILMGAWVMPLQASFEIMGAPSGYEYGNAHTGSFDRAIKGGGRFTPEEQAELSTIVPIKDYDRYYARITLNFGTLVVDQLKNQSTGTDASGSINKKRSTVNQLGSELAIGYLWGKNFRGELEYLLNKNSSYEANPVLSGGGIVSRKLYSDIKNNTLLANFYYDFTGFHRLRPYLMGGIGCAVNSVQASLDPVPAEGGSNTQRSLSVAWGLGGGMRLGIFSRWFLDLHYRYVNLGSKLEMKPNSSFKITGNYSMSSLGIGLIYLF